MNTNNSASGMNPNRFSQQPFAGASASRPEGYAPVQPVESRIPFTDDDGQFDPVEWHPFYKSCQRYFLDHAQHNPATIALAAHLNIHLPFQWREHPVMNSTGYPLHGGSPGAYSSYQRHGPVHSTGRDGSASVSLIPFVRRLVVTGWDKAGIMHGFFGDDWPRGVAKLQECERRNFLFAAKSVGWAKVKYQYDMSPNETVPYIKPLQNVQLAEIEAAEREWSQWLAMEDWMVGPRAPEMEDVATSEVVRDSAL